jgi:hypothetical protein
MLRGGTLLAANLHEKVRGSNGTSMTKSSYERALKTLEKTFEDRIRRPSGDD